MPEPGLHHIVIEDYLAIAVGAILLALGLTVLRAAGLATGGMAGVALLVSHVVPGAPGVIFAVLNLPFFLVAMRVMGGLFTLRTVVLSAAIAGMSLIFAQAIHIEVREMPIAALIGGALLGMGTLSAIRHGTGVGGVGVVTLWLAQARGWNVGRTQICIDLVILGGAAFILPPDRVAGSVVSAVTMGALVYVWHKPGRYAGISSNRLTSAG